MLVLGQSRQWHEQHPFLGPIGRGGHSKQLGGQEAGFVAGRGFFCADVCHGINLGRLQFPALFPEVLERDVEAGRAEAAAEDQGGFAESPGR